MEIHTRFALMGAVMLLVGLPLGPAEAGGGGDRPLIEYNDRSKHVSIQLPGDWRATRDPVELPALGAWEWPDEKDTKRIVGRLDVRMVPQHSRAELARYMAQHGQGKLVPGSIRRGAGWSESCIIATTQPLASFERFVEKGGVVYAARFVCHKDKRKDHVRFAHEVLDSFVIIDPIAPAEAPEGWSKSKVKGLEVWTDSENKALVKQCATTASVAWNVMKKSLKGAGLHGKVVRAMLYQNGARYNEASRAAFGAERDHAFYDAPQRRLAIKLMGEGQQDFEWTVQQAASLHYVNWYFGGRTPMWIQNGLMMYGAVAAEAGGKPKKPGEWRLRQAKRAVSASARRLDEYFTVLPSQITDEEKALNELWAWHWFFRHAKEGKSYRKTYELCLATLHKTGDVDAAHAVWQGTDFYSLQSDWKRWAAGGKKDDDPDPEQSGNRPNNRPPPDNPGGSNR